MGTVLISLVTLKRLYLISVRETILNYLKGEKMKKILKINAIHIDTLELVQTINSMNLSGYDEVQVLIGEDNAFYCHCMNPKVKWCTVDEIDVDDFADTETLVLSRPTDVAFALSECKNELKEARKEADIMDEYEQMYLYTTKRLKLTQI